MLGGIEPLQMLLQTSRLLHSQTSKFKNLGSKFTVQTHKIKCPNTLHKGSEHSNSTMNHKTYAQKSKFKHTKIKDPFGLTCF